MTVEEDPDQNPAKVHAGYQLESGLFSRVRHWIDLFGPLRLMRVMRISVSPIALFVVAAVYLAWQVGFVTFLQPKVSWGGIANPIYGDFALVGFSLNPTSLWFVFNRPEHSQTSWASFLLVAWTLFLWTPVALYLARQGGLLTADRMMEDFGSLFKRSLWRTPSAWLTAVVPTLCSAAIGLMVSMLLLLMRLSDGILFLEWPLAIAITLVSIPIGLLLFGSFLATPLAMASIANESQADPLDSLSRGYESLYRRPLHLISSTIFAIVLVAVVWLIAIGVAEFASVSVGTFTDIIGTSRDQQLLIQYCIAELPTIVALTTWFSMLGGIYLLARHDTGGQEVEDLWMPTKPAMPPMPQPNR